MGHTCGLCGMDHAKERSAGAERERLRRIEQWGEPFETIDRAHGALHDMVELRARQRDDGSWSAEVYSATGEVEFTGIAATEDRAQQLARAAWAGVLRKWDAWRARWKREAEEREAARNAAG